MLITLHDGVFGWSKAKNGVDLSKKLPVLSPSPSPTSSVVVHNMLVLGFQRLDLVSYLRYVSPGAKVKLGQPSIRSIISRFLVNGSSFACQNSSAPQILIGATTSLLCQLHPRGRPDDLPISLAFSEAIFLNCAVPWKMSEINVHEEADACTIHAYTNPAPCDECGALDCLCCTIGQHG